MCLTLRNAVTVLDHQDGHPPTGGYTRTRHHIGHLDAGDCWFPASEVLPHTVTGIHRRDGHIVLVDQFGVTYRYTAQSIVPTAVPDPRTGMRALPSGLTPR